MVLTEDPASVLEQFIQDVANLPAEMHHLMEEIQAKDHIINECQSIINTHDRSLQKFIKLNGSNVKNPKEEPYGRIILQNYKKAKAVQAEKVSLAEKAAILLDRHVKRLDVKIGELQADGSIPSDPSLPSLIQESTGNLVPPAPSTSMGVSGVSTPLTPLSVNALGGSSSIAHAAVARMTSSTANGRTNSPSIVGMQPHPMLGQFQQQTSSLTPTGMSISQRQRETSVSSETKRRKLNSSLGSVPTSSSGLARQSSLGPGTPKNSTPGSRAGSAGPRPVKRMLKKSAPYQQMRKKLSKGNLLKNSARRLLDSNKASPSTTGDDESNMSDGDGSDDDINLVGHGHDGTAEEMALDVDDEDGDDTKYCFCHNISYGDMVACDNDNCPYQWFHWGCIGITEEPKGEWLCPHCRKLPANQIRKAK